MRWLRWLAVAVAAVAVPGVAVVAYVATLDLNTYKADVQAAIEGATGRRVAIAGPLDLAWTPGPSLTVSAVRIANADWGSEPDMVSVGRLGVGVRLLPLLTGSMAITRLELSDVRLLLERGADGRANWDLGGASLGGPSGGAGAAVPDISQLDLERVAVLWKPGPKAAVREIRVDRLNLAEAAGGLAVTLAAELDGEPIEMSGTLPAAATLRDPAAVLPVDLKGSLAGKPFALAASLRVEAAAARLRADPLDLAYGELAARGAATVDLAGARPRIDGRLEADSIDLSGVAGGSAAKGTADPLDRPLPLDLLTAVDLRMELAAARLVVAGIAVDAATATATLADGVLTLDPVAGRVAEGPVTGRIALDAGKHPAQLALAASASGMAMGTLYRALTGEALVEGRGDAVLDLRGTGTTPRALLGSARGVSRLVIRDGVILNRYWELIAEDVATRFLPFVNDADRGRLNCLVSRFDIDKGIATATVLMVDSERVTVAGEGTVDLAAQTLDMRLVPRPKDPSLFSLATPILLTGPVSDPRPAPDPVAVAKGLGALAVGVGLGPVGVLLPFLSAGSADAPCPDAIAAAAREPGAAGGRSRKEQDKPGGIKGLFDSLRKAIE